MSRKFTLMQELKAGEVVVSMINFRDTIFVATNYNLYKIEGNKLMPVELEWSPEE